MTTTTFDIAKDAAATFTLHTWVLRDKVDNPAIGAVAEADLDDRAGELWGNNVCLALVQVNEVFQGSRSIDALDVAGNISMSTAAAFFEVGDGTGSPNITIDKSDAGTADVEYRVAGETALQIRLDADDDLEVRRYDPLDSYAASPVTLDRTSGQVAVTEGLTLPLKTDANRGAAGTAGRIIFNTDDGQLNVDDGTNWTLPDGSTT